MYGMLWHAFIMYCSFCFGIVYVENTGQEISLFELYVIDYYYFFIIYIFTSLFAADFAFW